MKSPKVHSPIVLLEQGTLESLQKAKARQREFERFHWDLYCELQYQRDKIKDQIFEVLNASCKSNFEFSSWQRVVKYRYGLHPLCGLGSLNDPGGRFNFGEFNSQTFEPFPALYIAQDKPTAIAESLLGQDEREASLPWDLALTKASSVTIVSVSGALEKVFDIRRTNALRPFTKLISRFTISSAIKKTAKRLGIDEPKTVATASALKKTLEEKKWRRTTALADVPSNPQIFGHLIYAAKIEAILYHSTITKKDCLAIYPRNFAETGSYIQLDDDAPMSETPTRLDAQNWHLSERSMKDLILKR